MKVYELKIETWTQYPEKSVPTKRHLFKTKKGALAFALADLKKRKMIWNNGSKWLAQKTFPDYTRRVYSHKCGYPAGEYIIDSKVLKIHE